MKNLEKVFRYKKIDHFFNIPHKENKRVHNQSSFQEYLKKNKYLFGRDTPGKNLLSSLPCVKGTETLHVKGLEVECWLDRPSATQYF
jgi:hypothetical protein